MDKMRVNVLTIVGYLLYSITNYLIFAPVFWFFLLRNLRHHDEKPVPKKMSDHRF